MEFKGLIFDLGNTLMYFEGVWPEVLTLADQAMVKTLAQAGFDLDRDSFAQAFLERLKAYYIEREDEFVELTTAHILGTLLADFGYLAVSDEVIRLALESFYQQTQAYWIPEKDTLPTLAALKEQGYRLGVISNAGDDADVQSLVDKAGVRAYLDFVLTSAACGVRKPDPKIFQIALDQWGFSPQQVAMVGDTLAADVLGGQNAGVFTIWITRRADNPANQAHQSTIQPDATIGALAELPPLLASLA
jgi:HAD superfamily hydrolase (TIGR01662 family)